MTGLILTQDIGHIQEDEDISVSYGSSQSRSQKSNSILNPLYIVVPAFQITGSYLSLSNAGISKLYKCFEFHSIKVIKCYDH